MNDCFIIGQVKQKIPPASAFSNFKKIEVQDPGNNYRLDLPRQDSEVLKIFYSNEELLSSKNEYMANYLARLLTQPD